MSVIVMALMTLLLVPLVIAVEGPHAWASLAVGQAVGTAFAVFIGFGWGVTGPTQVARTALEGRAALLLDSLRGRGVLAILGLPLAALITWLIVSSEHLAASTTAVSFALSGLLAGWYFTGERRPYALLAFDTIPRVIGTAIGAVLLLLGANIVVLPLFQLIGGLAALAISTFFVSRGSKRAESKPPVISLLRQQGHGIMITGVSAIYISVPIAIVAVVAPAGLPAYALADKLLRFATTGFAPIIQFLQGWVPGPDRVTVLARMRKSMVVSSAITVVAGVVLAILLPWLGSWLSSGKISIGPELAIPFGALFTIFILAQIIGLVGLIALDHTKSYARIVTAGAAFGVPAVFAGSLIAGAPGAVIAMVITEFLALAAEVIVLAIVIRKPGDSLASGEDVTPRIADVGL